MGGWVAVSRWRGGEAAAGKGSLQVAPGGGSRRACTCGAGRGSRAGTPSSQEWPRASPRHEPSSSPGRGRRGVRAWGWGVRRGELNSALLETKPKLPAERTQLT